jgi:hypothetical protein
MPAPAADHLAFARVLAAPEDQPAASFAALHTLAKELVGARMFTVLVFDFPARLMWRRYSTAPDIYPVDVADPLGDTIWERTLINDRQPLVLNSPEAMATLLPNVPELVGRGCEAMLNLPIVVAGEAIGAVNMLAEAGRYTAERVEAAQALVPGAAAILYWMQSRD